MIPPEAFALYTPTIQFFVLYFCAYRYEPLRLFRPNTERKGLKAWANVLLELRSVGEKPSIISGRVGTARFLAMLLLPTGIISGLLSLFEPLLITGSVVSIFQLQILFFFQFIPALLALVVLERRIGPRPLSPYSTIIPDSHGSSLVRHLGEMERRKR